ncbi:hypothetical protein ACOSQ4_010997 [Xanthoceras sorbifolium]
MKWLSILTANPSLESREESTNKFKQKATDLMEMDVVTGETYRSTAGCEELHILAVDDSSVDRKVIERLLKMSSCKVTAVEWNESSAVSGIGERRGRLDSML